MDTHTRDLFVRGVAAAKAGDAAEARFYFDWLLRLEPPIQEKIDSFYWLSEIETDPVKSLSYVKEILLYDPSEPRARRKLALAEGRLKPEKIIDADQVIPAAASIKDGKASRFICSRCGGRLSYQPDVHSLVCESCQVVTKEKTTLQQDGINLPEDDFIATLATARGHIQPVTTHVVHCQGCGASFIVSPGVLSRDCPYCFSTYVLDLQTDEDGIIPNGIIPFQVSLKTAKLIFTEWLESHLDMESVSLLHPMVGIYVPVWTFDILGKISWMATADRNSKDGVIQGEKQVDYNDIMMLGTIQVPPVLDASIKSFDLHGLLPFREELIVDWPAEIFQISLADASLRVRHDILAVERGEIERSLEQRVRNINLNSTKMYIHSFRLVMLPVWMSEFEIKHNGYKVAINGQNGCIYGSLPNSARKGWISEFLGI
jgi:hypothetical protein